MNDQTATPAARISKRQAAIALLLLVPAPTLGVTMAFWIAPGPLGKAIYFLSKLWILALPVAWLLIVEKGRLSLSPARRGGFGFAVLSGVIIGAAILVAYATFAAALMSPAALRDLATANGFDTPLTYLILAAYITLVNALLEEYVWRWFVFTRCEALMPGRAAVVAAAVGFMLHHIFALRAFVPWGLTALGAGGVLVGGVIWSWCYLRYRSIWPGYVSHAIVDVAVLAIGWHLLFGAA